ncbi:MAG: helicase, partial [Kosmotoga sp.]
MPDTKTFITNKEKLMTKIINAIFPHCDKLYFLVGYFFFSGFEEIYENLGEKDLKILVGLDIEHDFLKKLKQIEYLEDINQSRETQREKYKESLIDLVNNTDFFDNKKKQEAFNIYLKKIKDGTLQIKKTE